MCDRCMHHAGPWEHNEPDHELRELLTAAAAIGLPVFLLLFWLASQ